MHHVNLISLDRQCRSSHVIDILLANQWIFIYTLFCKIVKTDLLEISDLFFSKIYELIIYIKLLLFFNQEIYYKV